jgi:hypothetical protein
VLRSLVVVCAALAGASLTPPAVFAAEAQRPEVEASPVTALTEHGATLGAVIDPHGLETEYEFRLVWQDPDAHPAVGETMTGGIQTQTGRIAAGAGAQTVSFNVTSLQPGNTYWYELGAINSDGATNGLSPYQFSFHSHAEFPEGESNPPYEGQMPLFVRFEAARLEAQMAQTTRENEARQQQKTREAEEQRAGQATRWAAEAAALAHRQQEEAAAQHSQPPAHCVVPALRGQTLKAARRSLARAHCRIGRISRPRRARGVLVVVRQTPPRHRHLAAGTAVSVTLARRPGS